MLILLAAAALAAAATASPTALPPALTVPPGATLILKAQGRGVQIYACAAAADDPARFGWRLKAPAADLSSSNGDVIARHYAGPTWEGVDGGKVVGEVMAKAASPDPAAIDWLLLSAKSANGAGVLGKTRFVQRLNTVGGRAPDAGCSAATPNAETRVPYAAEYDFYS